MVAGRGAGGSARLPRPRTLGASLPARRTEDGSREAVRALFPTPTAVRPGLSAGLACDQLLETKSPEEAKPACEQLFDPHDPDRLTILGLLYGQHGRYEEAVKPLQEAFRLDPDSFEINHDLGLSYFRLRRYDEARKPLERAVALRPDFFGSNALLGATLYALGEDEAAYQVLGHAHALNPEDRYTADLLFKEALILAGKEETQKKYTSALACLRTAGELQPQDQEVQRRIAETTAARQPSPGTKAG